MFLENRGALFHAGFVVEYDDVDVGELVFCGAVRSHFGGASKHSFARRRFLYCLGDRATKFARGGVCYFNHGGGYFSLRSDFFSASDCVVRKV